MSHPRTFINRIPGLERETWVFGKSSKADTAGMSSKHDTHVIKARELARWPRAPTPTRRLLESVLIFIGTKWGGGVYVKKTYCVVVSSVQVNRNTGVTWDGCRETDPQPVPGTNMPLRRSVRAARIRSSVMHHSPPPPPQPAQTLGRRLRAEGGTSTPAGFPDNDVPPGLPGLHPAGAVCEARGRPGDER